MCHLVSMTMQYSHNVFTDASLSLRALSLNRILVNDRLIFKQMFNLFGQCMT